MAKPRITIIGLGLIGNSIGLALGQGKRDFEIVGHDREHKAAGQAKKMKAVDKTDWNLISACENADLIIMALPLSGIRATMEALAGELKPGSVIMDTASVKEPVLRWADEILPDTVSFVGSDPIVQSEESGGAAARADLFSKATWAICSSPRASENSVKLVADLADRLDARPLFLDPVEHDGMLAAVDHLPALASGVLINSLTSSPSWREMRKLAGSQFDTATRLSSTDPQVFTDMTLSNQENLVRWIDIFMEALAAWRDRIEAGDAEALRDLFSTAMDMRRHWDFERETGRWDEGQPEMPDRTNMLTQMFGFGGMKNRGKGNDKS